MLPINRQKLIQLVMFHISSNLKDPMHCTKTFTIKENCQLVGLILLLSIFNVLYFDWSARALKQSYYPSEVPSSIPVGVKQVLKVISLITDSYRLYNKFVTDNHSLVEYLGPSNDKSRKPYWTTTSL